MPAPISNSVLNCVEDFSLLIALSSSSPDFVLHFQEQISGKENPGMGRNELRPHLPFQSETWKDSKRRGNEARCDPFRLFRCFFFSRHLFISTPLRYQGLFRGFPPICPSFSLLNLTPAHDWRAFPLFPFFPAGQQCSWGNLGKSSNLNATSRDTPLADWLRRPSYRSPHCWPLR